ncbi:MAG TPA: OsmC family protein [Actinomycetaceae bacterium]|nr:OsmC family protein [Actinomycetaceae bacterium]
MTTKADELAPSPAMTIERTGVVSYVARKENGAHLTIGDSGVPGSFTPGELLKLALAACNAMSADARLAHALGPDFPSETMIETVTNTRENRYQSFTVTLTAPIQDLDEETRAQVEERADRAVRRHCTVGRTLEAGAGYEFRIRGDGQ